MDPFANLGAGWATGVPAPPDIPSAVVTPTGSYGGGVAGQYGMLGFNFSTGKVGDLSDTSCQYWTGCVRVGWGLFLGGGGEVAGDASGQLENGWDFSSVSYFATKVKMGFLTDSTLGLDGLSFGRELVGAGMGPGAVGVQWCPTYYFNCN